MEKYRTLFGPVPSRRLGRSLGVDLTPYKTCNFDCVFCQLGRTSNKTVERKPYVPVDFAISELASWLKEGGEADYITLSGSGEPTLNSGFGQVLEFLKDVPISSALLTNGSTLVLPEVRKAASLADVVKVSLSVWDQHSLEMINRPHPSVRFDDIVEGQKKLREELSGELWMEVFVLAGMNSMRADMEKIAAVVRQISPDRIHLNTVTRPPAEDFAAAPPESMLEDLTGLFDPPAEVVAEFSAECSKNMEVNEETVMAMLRRRPCTMAQIAEAFGLHLNEVSKFVGKLGRTGRVRAVRKKGEVYYNAVAE